MYIQCSGGSRSKGDESPEDERSGRPWEVDNNHLRAPPGLILLQLHKKLPKNSVSTILLSFSIWNKLERWKSLISGCLMSWPQIKKIVISKCCLLLFYATMTNHFLIRLWCVMKVDFIWEPAMTKSVVGQRRSSKALSKAKLKPKEKVMVTGDLLPIWSTTAFWILAKPLHLRSMLSKLMRCMENCRACSQHWSTEKAQFFSVITRDYTYKILHYPPYSSDLLPTGYHFFKLLDYFLQEKCFHN